MKKEFFYLIYNKNGMEFTREELNALYHRLVNDRINFKKVGNKIKSVEQKLKVVLNND